jgi:hypothetical protein
MREAISKAVIPIKDRPISQLAEIRMVAPRIIRKAL